uniref:prorelaxin 1 isoform X2 n=1 Tax=Jaculus jaculus TaxID=51337 RepID=UPI001E1B2FEA|nr:prorelaxin 1 isoform X2 [Jaculus jaculus]
MALAFSLQLLGFWLLLSLASAARVSEEWMDQVVRICGREFVRTGIRICGTSMGRMALSQEESPLLSEPSAEIVPSDIDQDAEPLTMMLEFNPNLLQELKAMGSERSSSLLNLQHNGPAFKDSSLSFEKFKNTIPNKQNEAEDNSPSEQKHLGLEPHSRKKRQSDTSLSRQCCQVGCTRRSIAKFC